MAGGQPRDFHFGAAVFEERGKAFRVVGRYQWVRVAVENQHATADDGSRGRGLLEHDHRPEKDRAAERLRPQEQQAGGGDAGPDGPAGASEDADDVPALALGKRDVVALGVALAELDCREPPTLL